MFEILRREPSFFETFRRDDLQLPGRTSALVYHGYPLTTGVRSRGKYAINLPSLMHESAQPIGYQRTTRPMGS